MTYPEAWDKQEEGQKIHNTAMAGCLLHVTKTHNLWTDFMRDIPSPQAHMGAWLDDRWKAQG